MSKGIVLEEFDLNVRAIAPTEESTESLWWVVTCKQDKGLYLADPDLKTALSLVPEARKLLDKARNK